MNKSRSVVRGHWTCQRDPCTPGRALRDTKHDHTRLTLFSRNQKNEIR